VPNVTVASWNGPTNYEYGIIDVPDIDQRRTAMGNIAGLPNGGDMYCIPTAAMNWMAYIADHGYPGIAPGEENWQLPQNYEAMTSWLTTMGIVMGTNANTGTTGAAAKLAMKAWLSPYSFAFTVSRLDAKSLPGVSLVDNLMAPAAIGGNLIIPVVGWYKKLSQAWEELYGGSLPSFVEDTFARIGGHGFSLVGAKRTPGTRALWINDPASPDDNNETWQSTFDDNLHNVSNVTKSFDYKTMSLGKMSGYDTGYIDGYYAIKPLGGLTPDENEILLYIPKSILSNEPLLKTFPTGTGGNVLDLFQDPVRETHPYLIEGNSGVWQLDTLTGRSTRLATLESPKRVLVGGRGLNTYVLEDQRLVCLGPTGVVEKQTPLPRGLDAITLDEATQRLIGIALATRELYFFGADLRPLGKADLPELPGETGVGRVSLAVDPRDGALWLHRDGLAQVARLHFGGRDAWEVEAITLQGARQPLGLAVDDQGHLYVSDDGAYAEYDPSGRPAPNSLFTGAPAGGMVQILRSFDNADPADDKSPTRFNVLPEDSRQIRPDFATALQQEDTLLVLGGEADNRVSIVDRGPGGVEVEIDGYQKTFHGVRRLTVATGAGDDTVSFKRGTPGIGVATLDVMTGEGNDGCEILFDASETVLWPNKIDHAVAVNLDLGNGSNSAAVTFDNVAVGDGITQKVIGGDQNDSVLLRSHQVTAMMKESINTGFGDDVLIRDEVSFQGSQSLNVTVGLGDDAVTLRSRDFKGSSAVSINLGAGDDVLIKDEVNSQGTLMQKVHAEGGNDSLLERVGFNPQPDPPGITRSVIWIGGPGDDSLTVDVAGTVGVADTASWKLNGEAGDDTAVVNVMSAVIAGKWEFAASLGAGDDSGAVMVQDSELIGSMEVDLDTGGGHDSTAVTIQDSEILGSLKMNTDSGTGNDVANLETTNVLVSGEMSMSQKLASGDDVLGWSNHDVAVNGSLLVDVQGGLGIDVMSVDLQPLVNLGGLYRLRLAGQDGSDRIEARIDANAESRGRIVAEVLGAAGRDILGLALVGLGGPDTFEGLVDGGIGFDKAKVTRNVAVRACEEVEFID
jgi:hypothetical protein